MEDQKAYLKAKKRVEAKFGFYIHLAVYIAVSILLVIINLSSSDQHLWFIWPLLGWGIGVFSHGMGVFVFTGRPSITEKMIEKEMEKEASKKK